MEKKIDHIQNDKKWRDHYRKEKPFAFVDDTSKPKYYCLEMFPYPSGRLHMGHVRNYTAGDILARYKRAKGYCVLHPIGWDAFGLPAENAAIAQGVHPAKWTFENIDVMRGQLEELGFSYDYDSEVTTASEDYYYWGQWAFIQFYKNQLVCRKEGWVNWDPVDKTVLANEQVGEGGVAWRSGAVVERKKIEQWYFETTKYAKELYDSLDRLSGWSDNVKNMQRNWIGKSSGAIINFSVNQKPFPIFTTRPDTLFAATFMAIAFDHPELDSYVDFEKIDKAALKEFLEKCQKINQREDFEKEGFFTGLYAKHPILDKKIPIYIANFVLLDYGTGLLMGCPAHDERDHAFAKKYNIEIIEVVKPFSKTPPPSGSSIKSLPENDVKSVQQEAYMGDGYMVNSQFLNGLKKDEAIERMIVYLQEKGLGERKTTYRLKDWLVSRQRYWGNPIPVVWEDKEKKKSYRVLDEDELPVRLPTDFDFGSVQNPLVNLPEFSNYEGKGKKAFRESDTLDTFTCSSWYFMRFIDSKNDKMPFDRDKVNRWLPVDQYIGGIEHACLHLLYARFWHKAYRDMGLLEGDEPFSNLLSQGMVLSRSYFSKKARRYFNEKELGEDKSICPLTGDKLISRIEAMSKSKKNGVDPSEVVGNYGADTIRMSMMFAAPIEREMVWDNKTPEGCYRFLQKVERFAFALLEEKDSQQNKENIVSKNNKLNPATASTITATASTTTNDQMMKGKSRGEEEEMLKVAFSEMLQKIEEDIDKKKQYNTPVSSMMIFFNVLSNFYKKNTSHQSFQLTLDIFHQFLICLNIYCPFLTEELNERLYGKKPLYDEAWPKAIQQKAQKKNVDIAIQVNGKLRATINIDIQLKSKEIIKLCKEHPNVSRWIEGRAIKREIYVPNKIVNLVV